MGTLLLYYLRFAQQDWVAVWPEREGGVMLIYCCPTTGRVVHSNLDISEAELMRLRPLKLSLWCPYCQEGHAILGKDADVGPDGVRSAA
jgi:hypothetical protein